MRLAIFGTELEENLALRYVHAAAVRAGHEAEIYGLRDHPDVAPILSAIVATRPDVVGLSMTFTHSAMEFVRFSQALRDSGYLGHITAGGHFATLHAKQLLEDAPAIDSVLHGEGEEAIVDLLNHLDSLDQVVGMTRRLSDGKIVFSGSRHPPHDLDTKAWPTRPGSFDRYLGLPIANMLGSRGCYANCSFCSIIAWSKEIGGQKFRMREPAQIAAEMAQLYHERGVRIFNFHDDNFFLPKSQQTVARFDALRQGLDDLGVGRIALQAKTRPDTIDPEVVAALRRLGCFRLFVGVESNSVNGLKSLNRGIRNDQNHTAMRLLLEADFHVTFNLLAFEPNCTIDDTRCNIAFIREYAQVPLNIARTEIHGGTPYERELLASGELTGSYFGYDYRMRDPGGQRVFEVFRQVFLERCFKGSGMNLRAMAVDYQLQILKHFWPERATPELVGRVKGLIRVLNTSNADLLEQTCDFAETAPTQEAIVAFADRLRIERIQLDTELLLRVDRLLREIEAAAQAVPSCDDTPGYERGGAGTKAAGGVAVAVAAGWMLFTVFGDNFRKIFGASTELANTVTAATSRPSQAPGDRKGKGDGGGNDGG